MMTKKDFVALADALKDVRPRTNSDMKEDHIAHTQWAHTRDRIADFCCRQNPSFRLARWLDYIEGICGPNGGIIV